MEKFDCVIVGAGLAGSFAAYFLSEQGLSSLVIDKSHVASGASGNDRGHMIPYVTSKDFSANYLFDYAFDLSGAVFCELNSAGKLGSLIQSPALQFPSNERPQRLINRIYQGTFSDSLLMTKIDRSDATDYLGFDPGYNIALYEKSFSLSPPELCRSLLSFPGIKTVTDDKVISINTENDRFYVETDSSRYSCDNIIIANAFEAGIFVQTSFLKFKKVRGQICTFNAPPALSKIKIPLCYNGYLLPEANGHSALIGTTYDYDFLSEQPCAERNQKMIQTLKKWVPTSDLESLPIESTRVSFRTVTFDRIPYAGKVEENIYVSVGHGSRGLHSASASGKMLADQIKGSFIPDKLAQPLDPNRSR